MSIIELDNIWSITLYTGENGPAHCICKCPTVYAQCGENDPNRWYCTNPEKCKQLLVFFRKSGIYCTHIPIAAELAEKLSFKLESTLNVPKFENLSVCPFSFDISGRNDSLCRYISKIWNY